MSPQLSALTTVSKKQTPFSPGESLKFLLEFGFAFSTLELLALPLVALLLHLVTLLHHLDVRVLVVLRVLHVAIGRACAAHRTRVVLRGVLRLFVQGGATTHRYHTDVLCYVILVSEFTHVVLIDNGLLLILSLPLLNVLQLASRKGVDLAHDISHAMVLSRNRHALQLL